MPTLKYDAKDCSRCGGTGEYSYNQEHGTTCFMCGFKKKIPGTGKIFSYVGRKTYAEAKKIKENAGRKFLTSEEIITLNAFQNKLLEKEPARKERMARANARRAEKKAAERKEQVRIWEEKNKVALALKEQKKIEAEAEEKKEAEKEMKTLSKSKFFGNPSERLEREVTLIDFHSIQNLYKVSYYQSDFTNIYTLSDSAGNIFTYIGSAVIASEKEKTATPYKGAKKRIGNKYRLKFTVKTHKVYVPKKLAKYGFEGVEQTIISRPKVI